MNSAPINLGCCALCLAEGKLERSHIMPRFVYRALAATAHDGPVQPLLCGQCEDRFSVWESQFARDIFIPHVAGNARPVKYGPWLLKFAASVCWRILDHARRSGAPGLGSAESDDCLDVWRDFLRGRRPEVGPHQLRLLGWDEATSDRGSIAFGVAGRDSEAWVRAQMGPLTLVGLIGGQFAEAGGVHINPEGKLKMRSAREPHRALPSK